MMLKVLTQATEMHLLGSRSRIKYVEMPFKDLSRNKALVSQQRIYSTVQEGCNEGNDPEDENNASPKVEQLEQEQLVRDLLFLFMRNMQC